MSLVNIYVGAKANQIIKQQGFYPGLFDYFLGASGGPKWFVLAGLDRVIFPEYFRSIGGQIQVIGSSAGAFRAACLVQNDSFAAINRLAEYYSQTVYSKKPTDEEVTQKAQYLIEQIMGDHGILDLLANKRFKAHFIASRCRHLLKSENKYSLFAGLVFSFLTNIASRSALSVNYERVIFSAPKSQLSIGDPYQLPTQHVELTFNNVKSALLASGSIPGVMKGVNNIVGAPMGTYRDGGLIDYHFDMELKPEQGLTLYPHYSEAAIAGWFDKALKYRKAHAASFDNVVMIVPSQDFVNSLPYARIPTREDFKSLSDEQRLKYWQKVLAESDRLGEYFMNITRTNKIVDEIKPFPFSLK